MLDKGDIPPYTVVIRRGHTPDGRPGTALRKRPGLTVTVKRYGLL